MTYRIWIWADANGGAHVGAGGRDAAVAAEQVYPSQMAYRVVYRAGGVLHIGTRTAAREAAGIITAEYPRARGGQW